MSWWPILAAVALGGVVYWGMTQSGEKPEGSALTSAELVMQDDRIQKLFVDCHIGKPYEQDTSDLMEVVVSKLERGGLDVLHRYQEVLAEAGEAAIPELKRLFEQSYGGQFDHPMLLNVLGTCAMMNSDAGLEIARSGFGHPREDVRLASLDVIAKFGNSNDYETISGWLDVVHSLPSAGDYVKAMGHCDLERLQTEALEWLETSRYPGLWSHIAPLMADVTDLDQIERLKSLVFSELAPQPVRAALLIPALRNGDELAEEELRERLRSEVDQRVTLALDAILKAGRHELAIPILQNDERAGVRERAASVLAAGEHTPESLVELNQGLSDSDSIVRQACLRGLLERKDEAALARVISDLTKGPIPRDNAVKAMMGHWDASPELAQRAFDVLTKEYESHSTREGYISVLKNISLIPLQSAGHFLLDHEKDLGETISGLRTHRWLVGHVFNSGQPGMEVLYQRLAEETDPLRRVDLIGMIWQDKSEASEQVLLEVLTDPENDPVERLWAADRLTRISKPETVAPIVKFFYTESNHRQVRPALQCLLWTWYGTPNP